LSEIIFSLGLSGGPTSVRKPGDVRFYSSDALLDAKTRQSTGAKSDDFRLSISA